MVRGILVIKHIVLWKLKESVDGRSKKEWAAEMKAALEGLVGKVPGIKALEVGLNFNTADTASDISLYTVFDGPKDLEIYQKHPEHMKVVELVKKITTERRVSDYEV